MNSTNLNKAIEFDQNKQKEVIQLAMEENYDPELCLRIWSETVHVEAIEAKKQASFSNVNKKTMSFVISHTSVKPYNFRINFSLKKLLNFSITTTLTTNLPELKDDKIKLGLFLAYKVFGQMIIQLSDQEVAVLNYLNDKNAFEYPIDEQRIYHDLPDICVNHINHLYELRCITIENEKVWLNEKIAF